MGDTGSALASARVDSFTISSSPRKRRRPNASQNGVGNNAVVDAFGDDSDSDEGTTAGTYVFGQFLSLEDAKAKSKRLEQEGVVLAESEKFQSAIGRWNQAIECTPGRHTLHEMKAQAFLAINENFQAIQAATREFDLALTTFKKVQTMADVPPDVLRETTEDIAFVNKLISSRNTLLQGDAAHSAVPHL